MRMKYIDILRGIGIIIMVSGHIGFGGKFDRYIHTFHMPLFFLISGYLYNVPKEYSIYDIIINKMRKILVPYGFFIVINYTFWLALGLNKGNVIKPLIQCITYNTSGLPIAGALWFLTAIFWVELFYIIVDRSKLNRMFKAILLLVLPFCISIYQTINAIRLPLTLDISAVCLGFYHIGRTFREKEEKIKNFKVIKGIFNNVDNGWSVIIGLLLANAVIAFCTPYVNIKMRWYGLAPVFWINALMGVAAYYLLSIKLNCHVGRFCFLRDSIEKIGINSIVFLGLNQLAILLVEKFVKVDCKDGVINMVLDFCELWIVIILLQFVGICLNNEKLKFLIGK